MRNFLSSIYVNVDVDVDLDDVLGQLNRREKEKLLEYLESDLDIESDDSNNFVGTNLEKELYDICNKIYENRNWLTNEDRELLIKLSKKGYYDVIS